ncbi:MAG: hypothetical protein ACK5JD_12605 [Mangrovibacterium sp.]
MTIQDLKHKLITRISQSKDDRLLEEMYRLLTNEDADTDILELNPEQKEAIEKAQTQYSNGQFLSQEQADKEIDEWLDK